MSKFLTKKDIILVVAEDWDGPWRHYHKLADELARQGNRVLFVEAYYSLFKFFRKPNLKRFFRFLRGARIERERLWLVSPPSHIPGGEFFSFLSRWNWAVARFFIRRAATTLGFTNPILWLYSHHADPLIGTCGESLSLYFCGDQFAGFFSQPWLQRRVAAMERRVVQKADVVITVSETLSSDKAPYAKECHTVDHGTELHLFLRAEEDLKKGPVPFLSDIDGIPHPIIGFQGVVRRMIDLDLVADIAQRRPAWSLVFVGPVAESSTEYIRNLEALKRFPNVRFLGPKKPEQIPYYIFQFDVCIIPYIRSVYVSPLKFYEYVSAGKPVVTTIPVYSEDERVVLTIRPDTDPVEVIERAMTHGSPAEVEFRKEIGRNNSWAKRVEQIGEILERVAERKRAASVAGTTRQLR